MQIMTACDSSFFHCVKPLADGVRRLYHQPLLVYNIGLTSEETAELDCTLIPLQVSRHYKSYTIYQSTPFINATHKPSCLRHYFEHFSEPVLYVDADCLFCQRVELDGFDIGITVKPKRKLDIQNFFNGILNSGVLFFRRYPKLLLDRWMQKCAAGGHTDQSALAEILSETINWRKPRQIQDWHGFSVRLLPVKIYNDYHLKTGKIFHFKGLRHSKEIYPHLLEAMQKGKKVRREYDYLKNRLQKEEKQISAITAADMLIQPETL
ncbi:MAG TPA: putative nucleotide-diphospho-sugar transferase [Anaerohalosphaeraceae bacterium]|nr:putative nucleotide-diphospho-sugar transferase [Anaerohalosphaeraceae bacterium]HOL89099.1 putative nucleotide-diphospho-sugar transferase [Anaerohalosphaeraceae bacterium]HPP56639.1 putative nucleotide-diphospho-sugar transferase [Anaerohalosphaeraceae bacterium]